MLFMSRFVMLSRPFIVALWSPAGEGLTSWFSLVMFNCVFVTFPCGILGHVWYLSLWIPDLCNLSNFTESFYKNMGILSKKSRNSPVYLYQCYMFKAWVFSILE